MLALTYKGQVSSLVPFNLYIEFGEEISEIYMRKRRGKRAAFLDMSRDSLSSNKRRECLRYPTQARGIRLEYLIENVNVFNIDFFLDYLFLDRNVNRYLNFFRKDVMMAYVTFLSTYGVHFDRINIVIKRLKQVSVMFLGSVHNLIKSSMAKTNVLMK